MPEFTFEAIDQIGNRVTGTDSADSEEEVIASLVAKGLQPIHIKRIHSFQAIFELGIKKIKTDDILYFTSELADLLEAGVPLERALVILADA
jgi:general secretion pathway protein F